MIWLLSILSVGCTKQAPSNIAEAGEALRAPAPQDFVFGPGDVLDLNVWRHDELDMTITVAPDGRISMPLIGEVVVTGLTYPELISTLEGSLSEYIVEPSVAVNIVSVSNQKVFILGEVQNPAVLQIANEMTILEALIRTGGIHQDARTDNVLLIRGDIADPELYLVDVDAIYAQGDMTQLVQLQKGDIVYVPAKTITNVERFFRRVQGIIAPFVGGSVVYRNAIQGDAQGSSAAQD
ncbi:MAG: hypothetical protein GY913_01015 [Proteobacteria bacterium]|nr:hypothetical protein [Pseudomonadota bacterium]MCP4915478.1 hypothetical protein [Pseudomonadota bacterium]